MNNKKSGSVSFQPYARIISILGDQLISDKWVGVLELVKNCYDADAESVKVKFIFTQRDSKLPSMIEIVDDGVGMNLDTILNVWMKPATPNKLNKKKDSLKRYTQKKRVMQGDKGVGRFAIYKLGNHVELFTKTKDTDEIKLTLNFGDYGIEDDKSTESPDKFLHEIENIWEIHKNPIEITSKSGQGTLLRISALRNNWAYEDLEKLSAAFFRMMPPGLPGITLKDDFIISLFWDEQLYKNNQQSFETIIDKAPYYFEGTVDNLGRIDSIFAAKGVKQSISVDPFNKEEQNKYDIWKLKEFQRCFIEKGSYKSELTLKRKSHVGGFLFFFYAFDLNNPAEPLSSIEKAFLKETSVYLYRDNIRVYPYGELGDDWLHLSKSRAEDRAGNYFSYNDLLGYIFITQSENEKLRDAADREGLMNVDGAKDDFIALIQAVLKIMKDEVRTKRALAILKRKVEETNLLLRFNESYTQLHSSLNNLENQSLINSISGFLRDSRNLIDKYQIELQVTQELAGTGMVVEKSTHEILSILNKVKLNNETTAKLIAKYRNDTELITFINTVENALELIASQIQLLQPLFRVSRKIKRPINIGDAAKKALLFFSESDRKFLKVEVPYGDLIVETNLGLVLQVFINLIDNAVYWMENLEDKDKQILIVVDSVQKNVIVADSGPGIEDIISEVIFTEFFTRKSNGRGLGLYIARELLDKINAEIYLVTNTNQKLLRGANFRIQF